MSQNTLAEPSNILKVHFPDRNLPTSLILMLGSSNTNSDCSVFEHVPFCYGGHISPIEKIRIIDLDKGKAFYQQRRPTILKKAEIDSNKRI